MKTEQELAELKEKAQPQNLEITMKNLPSIEESLETLFKFSHLNEKIDITSARAMKKQIGRALEELAELKRANKRLTNERDGMERETKFYRALYEKIEQVYKNLDEFCYELENAKEVNEK